MGSASERGEEKKLAREAANEIGWLVFGVSRPIARFQMGSLWWKIIARKIDEEFLFGSPNRLTESVLGVAKARSAYFIFRSFFFFCSTIFLRRDAVVCFRYFLRNGKKVMHLALS